MYWDVVKQKKDLWVLGGRGNWLDKRWQFFLPKFDKERIKAGVNYRHIYYNELKNPLHPNHKITKILKTCILNKKD